MSADPQTDTTIDCLVSPDDPDLVALLTACVADIDERYHGGYSPPPVVPDTEYFVARLDGSPVGCVGLRTRRTADGEPVDGEVKRLYVADAGRRRGLARLLMSALQTRARERGLPRIVLETGTRQPEAIALYLAIGYDPIPAFGEFTDSELSRCFGKSLSVTGQPTHTR